MIKIRKHVREKIKTKNIVIDEVVGTVTVTITIFPSARNESATKLFPDIVRTLVEENNIQIGELYTGNSVSNKYGEATGVWIFKFEGEGKTFQTPHMKSIEEDLSAKIIPADKKIEHVPSKFFEKRDKRRKEKNKKKKGKK